MSNAKHTPGPWKCEIAKFHDIAFGFDIVAIDPQSDLWHPIACQSTAQHTNSDCYRPEEKEANARLIAAAPELLEALEAMFLKYGNKNPLLDDDTTSKARAAIAKARGE